jgi:glycerol-3-phosphate acyltransferase PlsY
VNIRGSGSGNIGATNVARVMGKTAGIVTLAGDVAKGLIPVLGARLFHADSSGVALVGLASVLGHLWPVFFRFSGGKGVATAFGALIGMTPEAVAPACLAFLLTFVLSRVISLASIVAVLTVPLFLWQRHDPGIYIITTAIIAVLILFRHHENIKRLVKRSEPKFTLPFR